MWFGSPISEQPRFLEVPLCRVAATITRIDLLRTHVHCASGKDGFNRRTGNLEDPDLPTSCQPTHRYCADFTSLLPLIGVITLKSARQR